MRPRKWTKEEFITAAKKSKSIRQILIALRLKEAGGNYEQIDKYLKLYKIDTSHFRNRPWNKGLKGTGRPKISLDKILVKNSLYQSYKLKKRLIKAGLKPASCEQCGWSRKTTDGRLPLELDHVNGNSRDNRIENLRILCPNCHSLQPTHRGRNRKIVISRGGGTARHERLKIS